MSRWGEDDPENISGSSQNIAKPKREEAGSSGDSRDEKGDVKCQLERRVLSSSSVCAFFLPRRKGEKPGEIGGGIGSFH